jgi:Ca2+-binding EF-hand superfamily protein
MRHATAHALLLAVAAIAAPALAGDKPGADALAEVYARTLADIREADADGDGTLTTTESAEFVDRYDEDGDGKVAVTDVAQRVCLERLAGFAAGNDGAKRGGKPMPGPAPDKETREAGWALRIKVDPRFDAAARGKQLLAFDRNADAKIQREEWPGNDASRVFRKFDADKSGSLEGPEVVALAKDQIADLAKARRRPTRFEFVNLFDIDHDNQVTREEFDFLKGPATAFAGLDIDKDGVVTIDESQYRRTTKYDKDARRPGANDLTGKGAGAPNESKTTWDLLDKDGDKRVSPEEFGGSEPAFRRLDRNGDGYLTVLDA